MPDRDFYSKRALSILLFLLLINILCVDQGLTESDSSKTKAQLDTISKSIRQIEIDLSKNVKNHDVVKKSIVKLDKQLGSLHQRLSNSKSRIADNKKESKRLQEEKSQLSESLLGQQQLFQQQLQMAYTSQGQSKWKLLLSQKSLQHAGKNARIYDYIHQARLKEIAQIHRLADEIETNQEAIRVQQAELKSLLEQLNKEQSTLNAARQQKQQAQVILAKKIQKDQTDLKAEQNRKRTLQKLLKKFKAQELEGKFASKAGQLDWPVNGKLAHRFGEKRAGVEWHGVSIRAPRGTEVKAIYAGRVIFADWLDHYGWLMIVDHGNDFMSLYAHAEGLYKQEGDYVTQGELIAVVGDSGDASNTSLYFEIRRQGTPVDPAKWCVSPNIAYYLNH